MILTQHARDRYRDRVCPGAADEQVRTSLSAIVSRAVPTGERTRRGQALWEDPESHVRLVTKHDAGSRTPVVVTVLSPNEPVDEDEELTAAMSRFAMQEFARKSAEVEDQYDGPAVVEPRRGLTVVSMPVSDCRVEPAEPSRGRRLDPRSARIMKRLDEARLVWARKQENLKARRRVQANALAQFDAAEARRSKAGEPPRSVERARQVTFAEEAVRQKVESDERWLVDYLHTVMAEEQIVELAHGGAWPTSAEQVRKPAKGTR